MKGWISDKMTEVGRAQAILAKHPIKANLFKAQLDTASKNLGAYQNLVNNYLAILDGPDENICSDAWFYEVNACCVFKRPMADIVHSLKQISGWDQVKAGADKAAANIFNKK